MKIFLLNGGQITAERISWRSLKFTVSMSGRNLSIIYAHTRGFVLAKDLDNESDPYLSETEHNELVAIINGAFGESLNEILQIPETI